MTRTPPARPISRGQPIDPLWFVLLPTHFLFVFLFGVFSVVYDIPQLRALSPDRDPAAAQWFAIAVATSALVGLVGALTTITKRHDAIELVGCIAVFACMLFYFATLTFLTGTADLYTGFASPVDPPPVRPGSAFVPAVFGLVPALRAAVIVRDRGRRSRTVEGGA